MVEVDRKTKPPDGNSATQRHAVVLGVHQVNVVSAAVGPLGLEEEVRAQDGLEWIAGAAAQVLRPDVARVAGSTKPVTGRTADEVVAGPADRQELRVRPRDGR